MRASSGAGGVSLSDAGRIVAIVFGGLAGVALLLAAARAYWWSKNGDAFPETGMQANQQGAAFGNTTDNEGCLGESLVHHDPCDGFGCQIANNIFLIGCLNSSTPSVDFCEGVPFESSNLASASWRVEPCGSRGRSGSFCNELFGQIQSYWEGRPSSSG